MSSIKFDLKWECVLSMSLAAQNKQLLSLLKSNASIKDKFNSHILYVQSVQAVSFLCLGDSLSFRHHTMSVFVIVSLVFLFEWNRWPSDSLPAIYVVHLSSLHPFWKNLDRRHETMGIGEPDQEKWKPLCLVSRGSHHLYMFISSFPRTMIN